VNTTSTTTIDESSKRVIRKHASRHRAWRTSTGASTNTVATAGQVHRFRLGPQGLKHTPNQPRQVSQNITILSHRSDDQPSGASNPIFRPSHGTARPGQAASKSREGVLNRGEDKNEVFVESVFRTAVGQPLDDPNQEESLELVGWATEQHKIWLASLLSLRGVSLYSPSSNAMDPFNAMALTITPREQVLVRYYCKYASKHGRCHFPHALFRCLLSLDVIAFIVNLLPAAIGALKILKISPFLVNV
jgi:hypothetical protein